MQAHIRKFHPKVDQDDTNDSTACVTTVKEQKRRVLNGHLREDTSTAHAVPQSDNLALLYNGGTTSNNGTTTEHHSHSELNSISNERSIAEDNDCDALSPIDGHRRFAPNAGYSEPSKRDKMLPEAGEIFARRDGDVLSRSTVMSPSRLMSAETGLTGEMSDRPFQCEQCGKPFKTKWTLANHVVLHHSAESPFACGVEACVGVFRSDKELNVHRERTHGLAPKKYPCTARDGCTMQFAKYGHYRRHLLSHAPLGENLSVLLSIVFLNYCRPRKLRAQGLYGLLCGPVC